MVLSFKEQLLRNKQKDAIPVSDVSFKEQLIENKQAASSSTLPLLSPSKFAQIQTKSIVKKIKEPTFEQLEQIRSFAPFTKQFELTKQEMQLLSGLSPKNRELMLADIQAEKAGVSPEKSLETPFVDIPFAASIGFGSAGKFAFSRGLSVAGTITEALLGAQTSVLSEPFVGQITEIVTEKAGKIDPRLKPLAAIGTSIITGIIAAKSIDNIAKSSILKQFRLKKIVPDSSNVETALETVTNDIKAGKVTSDFTENVVDDIANSIKRNLTTKIENEVINDGLSSQIQLEKANKIETMENKIGVQKVVIEPDNTMLPVKPEDKGMNPLREEIGAVKLPDLSAIEQGVADYSNAFSKLFTKWKGLDINTKQTFIAIEETDRRIAEQSVDMAVNVYKVKEGINKETRLLISDAIENKQEFLLPKHLRLIAEEVKRVQDEMLIRQKKNGIKIDKWPDNWIKHNNNSIKTIDKKIDKIWKKVSNLKNKKNLANDKLFLFKDKLIKKVEKLEEEKRLIEKANRRLKNAGFVSRVTRERLSTKTKKIVGTINKKLITNPKTGRVFITRKEAEAAGFEVADPVEGVADLIYTANKNIMMKNLIDTINGNSDFSSKIKIDPSWVKISTDKFPSARNRWYHPSIADAVNELTWTDNSGPIFKVIDKFNMTWKHIGFYNPFIMLGVNDVQQAWQLGGFAGVPKEILGLNRQKFKNIINAVKNEDFKGIWKYIFDNSALNDVLNKSDLYLKAEAAGLFSNVLDRTPHVRAIVEEMLDTIEKTKGQKFAEQIKRNILNPLTILKDSLTFSSKFAWTGDQVWRMAGLRFALKSKRYKDMNFFEIVDSVNDNFASYNKIPKRTVKDLNRIQFTPSYKISNARNLAKIWSEPKRYWPELLRHYVFKLFMRYAMPGIATIMVTQKLKEKPRMRAHQLIMPIEVWNDKKKKWEVKEKVYSFSGPLFEETKVLNRRLSTTLQFNSSAVINILIKMVQGSRYHRMRDETGKPFTEQEKAIRRMSEFFKIGMPVERELRLFQREDIENFDKFMSLFGIAYVYHRKPKKNETEWANQLTAILAMLDLWTDWKKRGQEIKEDIFGKPLKEKKKEVKIPKFGKFKPLTKDFKKIFKGIPK